MGLNEQSLQRLGEIELERDSLLKQMGHIKTRLAMIDKEYAALKRLLSVLVSDGRWESPNALVGDTIYKIIRDAGRPLHYKEISEKLRLTYCYVVGSASDSNIVVKMNRDNRFIRVGRGIYGINDNNIEQQGDGIIKPFPNNKTNEKSKEHENRNYAEERDVLRSKFNLEAVEIDIKVTKNNIQALRAKLLGRSSKYKLPDDIDPITAIPNLEKKLLNLLEQRDSLKIKLSKSSISEYLELPAAKK